uniref:Uncharacterized protein n=1 Tax=uncultured Armatimonadetes bacterium TaxID=157466 RepID=A0A6J4JWQ7_9BACT|nr:hypothetical protein AVDCRST_MAG63-4286 [uncultured Armatimonadetes bacterium]
MCFLSRRGGETWGYFSSENGYLTQSPDAQRATLNDSRTPSAVRSERYCPQRTGLSASGILPAGGHASLHDLPAWAKRSECNTWVCAMSTTTTARCFCRHARWRKLLIATAIKSRKNGGEKVGEMVQCKRTFSAFRRLKQQGW